MNNESSSSSSDDSDYVEILNQTHKETTSISFSDTKASDSYHLNTLPTSYYSSLLPYQKPQVKTILLSVFPDEKANLTIVDCTTHIGGDAIHFSTIYPHSHIYAIDIDSEALKCMKMNLNNIGVNENNFTLINSDVVSWIRTTKLKADFYYFDPPWGGPKYYKEHKLHLYLGDERIETIINEIFEYKLTTTILLKIPRNFDIEDFQIRVKYPFRVGCVKKTHRRKITAYEILIISSL